MEFVKELLEEQQELLKEELRFAEDLEYAETKQRLTEVTDALNKLFICDVSISLDKLVQKIDKEKPHHWRDKINAIGYVQSLLSNEC
jgi:hypothetical protein